MKHVLHMFVGAMMVVTPIQLSSQSLSCDSCPSRSVAIFDLDIQVDEADMEKIGRDSDDLFALQQVTTGLVKAISEDDHKQECLSIIDGPTGVQILDETDIPVRKTRVSTPPPAGQKIADYIITGAVTKKGGKGLLRRVVVMTDETREKVAEIEMPYDFRISGSKNGMLLGERLLSLMTKIREFEKVKRDKDSEVAIGFIKDHSGSVKIIPEKETIKALESINVEICVVDCDKEPLQNMELKLSVTKGTIDPHKIMTDNQGKASVRYTAPCEAGNSAIEVSFNYIRPFESNEKKDADLMSFSVEKMVAVRPRNRFQMDYQETSTQDYEGQFLLKSKKNGTIVCVINYDTVPAQVTGVGMVQAVWSGLVDSCLYSGESNFKVDYKGEIVSGEGNKQWLEIKRVNEVVMGGNFTMNCGEKVQEVPHSFLSPDQEEAPLLRFELEDGAIYENDVAEKDSHHRYTLKMECK